jgi:hypothetical protein
MRHRNKKRMLNARETMVMNSRRMEESEGRRVNGAKFRVGRTTKEDKVGMVRMDKLGEDI